MKTLFIVAGTTLASIGSAVLFAPFAAARHRPPSTPSGDEPLVVEQLSAL